MASLPLSMSTTLKLPALSRRVKLVVIGATLGLTFIGFLARYLRRRRRTYLGSRKGQQAAWKTHGPAAVQNQNGDVRRSLSPATQRYTHRPGSVSLSDRHSVASTSSIAKMTPQQFGLMGMEALETGINYWEDALQSMIPPHGIQLAIPDAEKSSYNHLLEKILDKAYALQSDCEALFLHQNSVLFRDDASIASTVDRFLDVDRRTITSISSMDSFVSAQAEIADLREFDEFGDLNLEMQNLSLYQLALKQLDESGIPYRTLRTETLGCQSDCEYLAKLHCVRLAFQLLFKDERVKNFFTDSGRQLVADMLSKADKDPKDLLIAFDNLMEFVQEAENWPKIEEELHGRGVKCMTFYDIVLDFIILDAFEDLESPPSSVTAVVQNRWLSNGFKEIALSTAVWSVLKAKRRILKFSDGFIARFYAISEHMSPVFAWGFLGPESELKDICHFFRDQVLGFLNDIYNFHKARYTCVEDFAQDILTLAKSRYDITSQRLSL